MPVGEAAVGTLVFHEFSVGAAFHDAPLLDDADTVALTHRAQAMRDNEGGAAHEELSEGLESDNDFVFDGNADMVVPGILPEAASIPATRQDEDADHSLGYFAR